MHNIYTHGAQDLVTVHNIYTHDSQRRNNYFKLLETPCSDCVAEFMLIVLLSQINLILE